MDDFKDGHRKRLKEKYLKSENSLLDYEILELLLTYSIPRKDVKPIAKALLNKFKSIENVLNASKSQLLSVDGIGENSVILLNLFQTLIKRINENKNSDITVLDNSKTTALYCKNLLQDEMVEKFIVICLDNKNRIISSNVMFEGTVNFIDIQPRNIIEKVIIDNASSVIIAHNHPKGKAQASLNDINFTLNIKNLLKTIHVALNDHIIVGENEILSMRLSSQFSKYFE